METKGDYRKIYPFFKSHILPYKSLLIFRIICLFFAAWTIYLSTYWYHHVEPKASFDDPIFLTNQTLYLQTLYFMIIIFAMIKSYSSNRFDTIMTYFSYMLATNKFIVTALYWGAIYKGSKGNVWKDMIQVKPHAATFILHFLEVTIIPTLCTSKMYRLTLTYLSFYAIFNCFWTLNFYNIYPVLQWTNIQTYVWLMITLLLSAVFHYGILMGIQNIHKRKFIQREQELQQLLELRGI